MKQGKKYSIKWKDTFSYTGWWRDDEVKNKAKNMQNYIEDIGFYVGEFYGFTVLAGGLNKEEAFASHSCPIWIPTGCIKKIKELK